MSEKKSAQTWLPEPVYDQLVDLARRNERSIGAELRIAIGNHLRTSRGVEPADPNSISKEST